MATLANTTGSARQDHYDCLGNFNSKGDGISKQQPANRNQQTAIRSRLSQQETKAPPSRRLPCSIAASRCAGETEDAVVVVRGIAPAFL